MDVLAGICDLGPLAECTMDVILIPYDGIRVKVDSLGSILMGAEKLRKWSGAGWVWMWAVYLQGTKVLDLFMGETLQLLSCNRSIREKSLAPSSNMKETLIGLL